MGKRIVITLDGYDGKIFADKRWRKIGRFKTISRALAEGATKLTPRYVRVRK